MDLFNRTRILSSGKVSLEFNPEIGVVTFD